MIKNNYSINDMIRKMNMRYLEEFISYHELKFINRFGFVYDDTIEIKINFTDSIIAKSIYNEIKYNPKYNSKYNVRTNLTDDSSIFVSGAITLFDYFGTKEPNLLTLSREFNIIMKIEYIQAWSGLHFSGEIMYGELLARNTHIEVNMDLPELGLGGLRKIGKTIEEFDILLTRFYNYQTERLV